ncbi:DUF3923 family protein [Lacticaseibacillus paracasei]|uniref:DUF3923 family protein n=1 Tax=Lacticaseibacillus paracasei TaxID=1597 RepID=UPI0021CF3704|nr:DUF3923 family protein [Lacticaseibacillus paracasei]MCU6429723.1 DUF3923 family protein [Lacticaseibacillus paracasei]
MKHKGIWLINGLLALFAVPLAVIILIRRVDGSGHVETGRSRLAALAVLGVVVLIVILCEVIYLLIARAAKKG